MTRLILFVALFCFVNAAETNPPPEFYDHDVKQLMAAEIVRFDSMSVPFGQHDGNAAFREILKKENFLRCFVTVFNYGNPQACCYALIALREISPFYFRECMARFRKSAPKTVKTYSDVYVPNSDAKKLLDDIESGAYRWYFERSEKG